ncbi:preprotein translocase subunit YajC [Aliidiomarina shirensis]|uniref:Sec translocon accessory complex subunit YajC n=1 Tax=Aliidiomarina shirensis TaxID=1048642 RepID=A0A432WQQ8_9GAMM|nr:MULTISPECIES: preprotein translocase subunit YajC [Idiomarinaceae]EGN75217.1 preprotein translocase, YajC subunit [Idiomarina sp. A28L]RUO36142.1 preprotein translocase subunit YajC [Aliidiomarina shirensis]
MDFLIANAYAQEAGQQGGTFSLVIMLLLFGLIFYFLIYRPQAKRVKEHKSLVTSLAKTDEVLLQGGLIGKIVKVAEDNDFMVIALTEGVEVTVQKSAVAAVLPKGTIKTL